MPAGTTESLFPTLLYRSVSRNGTLGEVVQLEEQTVEQRLFGELMSAGQPNSLVKVRILLSPRLGRPSCCQTRP